MVLLERFLVLELLQLLGFTLILAAAVVKRNGRSLALISVAITFKRESKLQSASETSWLTMSRRNLFSGTGDRTLL